jgi:hypothetical protein
MAELIEISNSPLSGLKRKVEWSDLLISKKEKEIRLYTLCRFYEKLSGDTFGNEINRLEIKPFERILFAKNGNQVNPATGLIATKSFSGSTEIWIDVLGNISLTSIGQFDFFSERMNQPEIMNDVIEQIVHSEDLIYKTYDK